MYEHDKRINGNDGIFDLDIILQRNVLFQSGFVKIIMRQTETTGEKIDRLEKMMKQLITMVGSTNKKVDELATSLKTQSDRIEQLLEVMMKA